jgi:light-regulated signal transduction histidine kinase (bacteriophytochrome)
VIDDVGKKSPFRIHLSAERVRGVTWGGKPTKPGEESSTNSKRVDSHEGREI